MIKVGIVGGTGYTGVELLRLLAAHPQVELMAVTSRGEAGTPVAQLFPNLRGHCELAFTVPDTAVLSACDVVFFATPNGTAMQTAPELLDAGVKVIDLAADFRLKDAEEWKRWYGVEHACPDLLSEAVYGLPELNRELIRNARLVANPGCYPTAVTLGFLPLVEKQMIDLGRLIADAKSGVSGAGRKAAVDKLLGEAGDSFKAYAVPGSPASAGDPPDAGDRSGGAAGPDFRAAFAADDSRNSCDPLRRVGRHRIGRPIAVRGPLCG